jgi:nitrate/nitrite transporter NarK
MTVNMKIDLIGPARRGVALGINETAGYLGVAVTALATGYLATGFGLRPAPELLGAGYAAAGLALSVLAVRDTGVYRLWRDSGYAIGALIGGITAALASLDAAIGVGAILTAASGLLA